MLKESYDPHATHFPDVEPMTIRLAILGARFLPKTGRGYPSPFVEVECLGCFKDTQNKFRTKRGDYCISSCLSVLYWMFNADLCGSSVNIRRISLRQSKNLFLI